MDSFEVSGIRAKLETIAAKVFEEKIEDSAIQDIFSKINERYTDKRAADVFRELREFFGRVYMIALNLEKEARSGERQPTDNQNKREKTPFNRKRRNY